jgi:putative transposase
MSGKRYTEEQIIRILKEGEAGIKTTELCRKYGMSEQSFYKWKSKFGGMEVSDARRLKGLETENQRLKRIVADLTLDIQVLKEINSKNW